MAGELLDPKILEAYGNLTATAMMFIAFLLSMWLVARNFMRVLKLHTDERKVLMDDHRAERQVATETMNLMQIGTNQAIHGFEKTIDRMSRVMDRVNCIKEVSRKVN